MLSFYPCQSILFFFRGLTLTISAVIFLYYLVTAFLPNDVLCMPHKGLEIQQYHKLETDDD